MVFPIDTGNGGMRRVVVAFGRVAEGLFLKEISKFDKVKWILRLLFKRDGGLAGGK